jgi:hypothetical protein
MLIYLTPSGVGFPSPNTDIEVIVSGRQGHRAYRELNPACGSATSIGTAPTAFL